MKNDNILFRADGNSKIGLGHIMRCLSLADEAHKRGYVPIFVASDDCSRELVKKKGYIFINLHTDYSNLDFEQDNIYELINWYNIKYFFIDSYFAHEEYIKRIYQLAKMNGMILVCFDGNGKFPYQCDAFINYNIYGSSLEENVRDRYIEKRLPCPELFLGPAYAPLRKEFKKTIRKICKENVGNILVSAGGADSEHILLELTKQLSSVKLNYRFDIVIGGMNQDKELIIELVANNKQFSVYYNTSDIYTLMRNADIAISASGSTLYELCATHTPTITYVLADNQIPGAVEFDNLGLMKYVGDVRILGKERLTKELIAAMMQLADNFQYRKQIMKKMEIVDGNGTARIFERLEGMNKQTRVIHQE